MSSPARRLNPPLLPPLPPTPPPPSNPHTQVYWLNVMRSLQASSVNVFIWQTERSAPRLDLHPKRHLTKISSMAPSATGKSVPIVTGPVGKHVDRFPQCSPPREKKPVHVHTPSITVIQSSVNVPMMPPLLSKIHLVYQQRSLKCITFPQRSKNKGRVKELLRCLDGMVAVLCTPGASALGLVTFGSCRRLVPENESQKTRGKK